MIRLASLLVLMFLFAISIQAGAEVFKWVDDQGKIHFTDKPPKKGNAKRIDVQVNSFSSPEISPFKFDPPLISQHRVSNDVIMYSTTWCGVCKKAKRYFNKNNIRYKEYDVEKSEKGRKDYKKLNGRGVPIILVGSRRMNGFSRNHFEKIYQH